MNQSTDNNSSKSIEDGLCSIRRIFSWISWLKLSLLLHQMKVAETTQVPKGVWLNVILFGASSLSSFLKRESGLCVRECVCVCVISTKKNRHEQKDFEGRRRKFISFGRWQIYYNNAIKTNERDGATARRTHTSKIKRKREKDMVTRSHCDCRSFHRELFLFLAFLFRVFRVYCEIKRSTTVNLA